MRLVAVESSVALLMLMTGCTSGPTVTQEPGTTTLAEPAMSASTAVSTGSATPSASAAPKPPPSPVDPPMVSFPAGFFRQGSAGATGDEFGWQHDESVPAFELDVTEVTVEAYQACLDAGACSYAARGDKCNLERPREEFRSDPVNCVTFAEAEKYCNWRGAVLPTDGMWEYAAGGKRGWYSPWAAKPGFRIVPKGMTGDVFIASDGTCRENVPWQEDQLPSRKQYGKDTTCPVGTFPRGNSPEGLKDMEGNVSEWTSTIYCKLHKKECDPERRTVKGQAYNNSTSGIQHRLGIPATEWRPATGFRCARLKTPPAAGKNP